MAGRARRAAAGAGAGAGAAARVGRRRRRGARRTGRQRPARRARSPGAGGGATAGGLAGVVDLYAGGAVDPRPLVAATVGLEEAAEVLHGRRPPEWGSAPKVHVDPLR